jgi:predicted Zn-ribbon and HTH transcriptional regulator
VHIAGLEHLPADAVVQERPRLEVADIFRARGEAYRSSHALSDQQRSVMRAIETCRTEALGGHLDVCLKCGFKHPSYNSCRNRHCPKCQATEQAEWLEGRMARVLPTRHFHVVFTVPASLRPIAQAHARQFYALLIEAASTTLLELAKDKKRLGAQPGITAVLHTWTRRLELHPHLHCIVTAGGLSKDGSRWLATRRKYLFSVKVLSRLFRGKLVAAVDAAWKKGELKCPALVDGAFEKLRDRLYKQEWVVYAKQPFGGAQQVFSYLGRYTHRVALSNQRVLSFDEDSVRFITRGAGTASLHPDEFIRRFLLHVLPPGFVKIRHFGLYAAGNVHGRLEKARELLLREQRSRPTVRHTRCVRMIALLVLVTLLTLDTLTRWRLRQIFLTGRDPSRCPNCGATMIREPLPWRATPAVRDSS